MKTRSSLIRPAGAALLLALSLAFAGCATTASQPTPGPDGKVVIVAYDQVYVTGSHIPVLVPRSATVRTEPGISPLTTLSQDDVRRMMPGMMH